MNSHHFTPGKGKRYLALLLLIFTALSFVALSMAGTEDFNTSTREVLIRKIGHEILTQSGDRTSRVLPIKKIADNEYQISFEKEFTFQTDALVNTTRRLLATDPLATDYVVNVIKCGKPDITYSYAIAKNKKNDIVSCSGRKQPVACYQINIKFKPAVINPTNAGYLFGSLSFLSFIGIIYLRPGKAQKAKSADPDLNTITLGAVIFNPKAKQLSIGLETTELTGTETRLLHIFARSPNQIIERGRLQKEIWEDEGVIVGRSLDMFISKLRKKLEAAPSCNITVVRGKGYKLEIDA